jgi:hypothetical protein
MPADFCGEKGYYHTLLKMAIDKRMIYEKSQPTHEFDFIGCGLFVFRVVWRMRTSPAKSGESARESQGYAIADRRPRRDNLAFRQAG